jgi:magnesium transporter
MQEAQEQQPNVLKTVIEAVNAEDMAAVEAAIADLHPAEIADILESLPPSEREPVWDAVTDEVRGEVLVELHDEVRENLIEDMAPAELLSVAQTMDADDLAYILDEMPETAVQAIMDRMDQQDRERLRQTMAYPEETAGRLMDADIITIRPDVTVDVVLRYLRRHETIPRHTDALMVVDETNTFLGTLPLSRLLTAQPGLSVSDLISAGDQCRSHIIFGYRLGQKALIAGSVLVR